ncbi:PREDICTED: uncharacterized protein LOC106783721 [Polistes canadensis]|uniref:uncharacterized protein LOC106783721 n=1 Tax=Polistes canadensis TaxID=91411 RepID=UPI000718D93C|nr:PREDICTED: uncharacterized protein LOC106783721 [Polistes canadensis]
MILFLVAINTIDSLDYCYFPITRCSINLRMKANHDARIALRAHLGDDSNVYEIILGRWGNTMSAIKRNNVEPNVAEAETVDLCGDYCNIWIKWSCDGMLSFFYSLQNIQSILDENYKYFRLARCNNMKCTAKRMKNVRLMTYRDKNPFVINYIGFSTAWGATEEWVIINESKFTALAIRQQLADTSHLWVDYNNTMSFPQNAAIASEDGLYVGRAHHKDSVTPGGIRDNICTLAWGRATHEKKEYQVLCVRDIDWIKSWDGSVPLYALPVGQTEDDHALFIGRVLYNGLYYVGKIHPSNQICHIPVNGQEVAYSEYETLVLHNYNSIEHIGR